MARMYICDGCGKESNAASYAGNRTRWFKPHDWFQRSDDDGIQDACSRECIDKIADKSGKTSAVAPI